MQSKLKTVNEISYLLLWYQVFEIQGVFYACYISWFAGLISCAQWLEVPSGYWSGQCKSQQQSCSAMQLHEWHVKFGLRDSAVCSGLTVFFLMDSAGHSYMSQIKLNHWKASKGLTVSKFWPLRTVQLFVGSTGMLWVTVGFSVENKGNRGFKKLSIFEIWVIWL